MRWRFFLFIGWTALTAPASLADVTEAMARKAVLDVDTACAQNPSKINLQPSGPGFVARCDGKGVARFYFAAATARGWHAEWLFAHKGDVSYTVRPLGLNLEYEDGDDHHEMSWYFGLGKAELRDDFVIVRGKTLCPKERYRDHENGFAERLKRPTRTTELTYHRVSVEHEVIVCRGGKRRIATPTGLLILLNGVLEVGPFGTDVLLPANGSNPAHVAFSVVARVAGKSLTLHLQPRDNSKNPIVGGDARTGDHFEIWIAPPAPEPTCDELLQMTSTCTAAVEAPPVRIWIGRAVDGTLSLATEPRDVAPSIAVTSEGATITVELGGALPDSATTGGLAVLYHDQASGTTIGTANPERGNFSLLGKGAIRLPPVAEGSGPLK